MPCHVIADIELTRGTGTYDFRFALRKGDVQDFISAQSLTLNKFNLRYCIKFQIDVSGDLN